MGQASCTLMYHKVIFSSASKPTNIFKMLHTVRIGLLRGVMVGGTSEGFTDNSLKKS